MNTVITSQKLGKPNDTGKDSGTFRFMSFMLLCLVTLCLSTAAYAQKAVSGKVTDAADNSGLPGVSVSVKGTTTGTVTDASGSYNLSVPNDNTTLVFSFVGYVTQEVAVGSRTSVDVSLAADVQSLQEVVVIGYGEQRKQDVTGGVAAIGPKDFNKGLIASPEQLLQGRAAGIQVTPASGEPGAGINIRIRGAGSIRGGNNPLFVVDGIPLDGGSTTDGGRDFGAGSSSPRNPLNFLNPADIENITVLKDGSAAAIYGSRGANGVVLITTKRGKAGQQSLNVSASTSIASTLKRYDLLSADEFLSGLQAAGGNSQDPAVNKGNNTNWQNEIFRTAVSQNYTVDYGGGNDNTNYRFSLGYSDQQGIIKNSGFSRLNGRINASHELFNDKVVIDLNLTTTGISDKFVPNGDNAGFQGNLIGAALQANPTFPVRNDDGTYFTPGGNDFRNPASLVDPNQIKDIGNTNRTLGRIGGTWRIVKGLSYKINFGIDNSTASRRTSIRPNIPGFGDITNNSGRAVIQNRNLRNTTLEHTLNYNGKVGIGTLEALAGFGYYRYENSGNFLQAERFLTSALNAGLPLYDVISGVNNKDNNKAFFSGADRSQNEIQSIFGRLNYNINDKYILTATVRRDGSSRFGPDNKYGTFPSFAGAWRISQESFMPQGVFDDLKIRANWGITGNQEYPGNTSKVIYSFDPNNAAATPQNVQNNKIKWEQARQWGVGIDFAILKSRLTGTLDYFNKSTKDLIFQAFYAQPAPAIYRWINLPGNINNTGLEFALNYDVLPSSQLQWQISYNMTILKNEVSGIGTLINTGAINGQGLSGAFAQQIRDGYPAPAFFLRQFAGYNENGQGIYPNGELLTYAGSPIPKFTFGLNNSFTYGKWNLNVFLNGATGFYVYNNTANAYFIKGNLRNGRNVTKEIANSVESADNFAEASTRFLEKGNFVRLSNFSLSREIGLKNNTSIKNLRISLTGQNVLLFTKYTGVDPEVNTNKAIDGVSSVGIDYTSYPSARTFTLGVSAGF